MTHAMQAPSDGLGDILADARAESVEYPDFLANHAPMIVVALHRLGASEGRLRDYLTRYRIAHGLVPPPPPVAAFERDTWRLALGDRHREADYRAFFSIKETASPSLGDTLALLGPGVGASALHGLMRLAYGLMRRDRSEIGAGLGAWAATYLAMPPAAGTPPITDDPAEVLARVAALPSLRTVVPETDLLWHNIRAVGQDLAFAPVIDWLAIDHETPRRMAATALQLFAATMDFAALHAVTGLHWVRLVAPYCPEPTALYRAFWQVIAALVPKMGCPAMPDALAVARWRHTPCPDWAAIAAAAVASDDEHDISLVFSAREEEYAWGDRLYRVVAARRMGLIG